MVNKFAGFDYQAGTKIVESLLPVLTETHSFKHEFMKNVYKK
jgi:hypothetical protein